MRETMAAAAEACKTVWRKPGIRLEIATRADIGSFTGDKKRVRQVLFNLLSNAIGFSSSGQTVRLKAERKGSESVHGRGQGRGIPTELKERVFDRFESQPRARAIAGSGSACRSFVPSSSFMAAASGSIPRPDAARPSPARSPMPPGAKHPAG